MKKLFLTLVGICASISAFAISPFVEVQPVIAGNGLCMFNVQGGVREEMLSNLGLSAGAGITQEWNFESSPLIPIFVRGDYQFNTGGIKPFVSFDLGYAINTNDTDHGAVVVNPMVGVNFGKVYAGIGYQALCWTAKHADASSMFNLKIGYEF